jgi:hypothetical protein
MAGFVEDFSKNRGYFVWRSNRMWISIGRHFPCVRIEDGIYIRVGYRI